MTGRIELRAEERIKRQQKTLRNAEEKDSQQLWNFFVAKYVHHQRNKIAENC